MLCTLCRPKLLKMGLRGDGRYSKASLLGRLRLPASQMERPACSKASTPKGSGSEAQGRPKASGEVGGERTLEIVWEEEGRGFGFAQVVRVVVGKGIASCLDGGGEEVVRNGRLRQWRGGA